MKTLMIIALAALSVLPSVASEKSKMFAKNIKKIHEGMTPEQIAAKKAELHEAAMMRTGGKLRKPGVGKGKFVVFNGQDRVADDVVFASVKVVANQLKVDAELKRFDGKVSAKNADALLKASGGSSCVFVVEDAESPVTVLTAPESRWSIVNVAALAADNAATNFVNARVRKEAARGLLFASNAYDAQNAGSLMSYVTSLHDLDDFNGATAPLDVLNRVIRAMPKMGMERWEIRTYHDACEEGWAPAPTNKYQKAVWEKVHALPTDPIVIKSDKAKNK